MADYTPVYVSGNNPLTLTASATITGGQIVENTGVSTVGPAGAASAKCAGVAAHAALGGEREPVAHADHAGVAAHDAASGARVTVWPLANIVHEIVATGTVTAGDGIAAGAAGVTASVVVGTGAAAGTLIGTALTTATGPNKVRFVGRG